VVIVSVTPEIGLDDGYTYAGGLGVLEADKFYAMARLNKPYVVITLLYNNGYVDYVFSNDNNPVPMPQRQPRSFMSKLTPSGYLRVVMKDTEVYVKVLEYRLNNARVVFLSPQSPRWAYELVDRLYIENDLESKFYKYVLLAKGAAEYIRARVGLRNVDVIDLQEAYTAMLPLVLPLPPQKYRMIIHTPGPWGHPSFPAELFRREFGYRFFEDPVILTELGLSMSGEVIVVSRKMRDVVSRVIPHHMHKVRAITNGVDSARWVDGRVLKAFNEGKLTVEGLASIKQEMAKELESYLSRYKPGLRIGDSITIAWIRRLTRYKRPDFVARFIEENPQRDGIVFVLGGKTHPYDEWGLAMMRRFRELANRYSNVVYIPDYDVGVAKFVLPRIRLMLFTPFPGWEASGTSFMKTSMNGAPTLSSRDGAVPELIMDGVNGWLFGIDERCLIDIGSDPRANDINEKEYAEFSYKLNQIIQLYYNNRDEYWKVAVNAVNTFMNKADIVGVLKQYYKF
jgi:starch phosphorylase